jgi:hypothetical protein
MAQPVASTTESIQMTGRADHGIRHSTDGALRLFTPAVALEQREKGSSS